MVEQETLLLASDGSPGALQATDWIQTHLSGKNRKIVVVTVVTERPVNVGVEGDMPVAAGAMPMAGAGSQAANTISGVGLSGPWVVVPAPDMDNGENYAAHWAEGHAHLKTTMERLHDFASLDGFVQTGQGHVADGILQAALDTQPTVVVVGRRGLNRLERWVMGSVSSAVVAKSPVPVIVIPDQD